MSLTAEGLTVDRLEDIITRMKANAITKFGPNTNVDSDSVLGQLIDVFAAELVMPNELALQIYDSFDPDQAEGAQLDNLAALLGLTRQPAEFTEVTLVLTGDAGVTVPTGSLVEAQNGNRFETLADALIAATALAPPTVTFANVDPDTIVRSTGSWLEDGIAPGTEVTITGSASNNNTFTVATVTALTLTLIGGDSLTNEGPVACTVTINKATVAAQGESTGPLTALATTIDTIVNALTGWATVVNPEDANPGANAETDLELRARMANSTQATGAGVDGAIEAQMLALPEVEFAKVFSNRSDMTVDGRPPHSFELVIYPDTGATSYRATIAELLFNLQPAGIESVGTSSFLVTDEEGFSQTVKYTFATETDIWLEVTLVTTSKYPSNGDDQVVQALLAEGDSLGVGDTVLNWKLIAALDAIGGITSMVINQGLAASPTMDANLTILETAIAVFDSARITVIS